MHGKNDISAKRKTLLRWMSFGKNFLMNLTGYCYFLPVYYPCDVFPNMSLLGIQLTKCHVVINGTEETG